MDASSPSSLCLTARELATVLAALRLWQECREAEAHPAIVDSRFADHFREHSPLAIDEIDALCERLNGGQ